MKTVLFIFFEVLSMPSRNNEWKRLLLVPKAAMQNNGFGGSYYKTQVTNLHTSKAAGLARMCIKHVRMWLCIPYLRVDDKFF